MSLSFEVFVFALLISFAAVVFLTPVLSSLALRRAHDRLAQTAPRRAIGPILFTGLLIWAAVVLVFTFGLASLLTTIVLADAHAGASTGAGAAAAVGLPAVLASVLLVSLLAFVGWRLHEFTAGKLRGAGGGADTGLTER